MSTLGIAVAALGSGIPEGVASLVLGLGFAPAGCSSPGSAALVVATLGVLVVRILQAPSQKPAGPRCRRPDPKDDERSARPPEEARPCCPSSNPQLAELLLREPARR